MLTKQSKKIENKIFDATRSAIVEAVKRIKNKNPIFIEPNAELNLKNLALESCIQFRKISQYIDDDLQNLITSTQSLLDDKNQAITTLKKLSNNSKILNGTKTVNLKLYLKEAKLQTIRDLGEDIKSEVIEGIRIIEEKRIKNHLNRVLDRHEEMRCKVTMPSLLAEVHLKRSFKLEGSIYHDEYLRIEKINQSFSSIEHEETLREALSRIISLQANIVTNDIHQPISRALVSLESGLGEKFMSLNTHYYKDVQKDIIKAEHKRRKIAKTEYAKEIEPKLIEAYKILIDQNFNLKSCTQHNTLNLYTLLYIATNYCSLIPKTQYGNLVQLLEQSMDECHELKAIFQNAKTYANMDVDKLWCGLGRLYRTYFNQICNTTLNREGVTPYSVSNQSGEGDISLLVLKTHREFSPVPEYKIYARKLYDRIKVDQIDHLAFQMLEHLDLYAQKNKITSISKLMTNFGLEFKDVNQFKASYVFELLELKLDCIRAINRNRDFYDVESYNLALINALQRLITNQSRTQDICYGQQITLQVLSKESGVNEGWIDSQLKNPFGVVQKINSIIIKINEKFNEMKLYRIYQEKFKINQQCYRNFEFELNKIAYSNSCYDSSKYDALKVMTYIDQNIFCSIKKR